MIRKALIFWILIALAVVGAFDLISQGHIGSLIFPLLIVATVFYVYRIAPRSRRGGKSRIKVKPSQKTMAKVAAVRKSAASPAKRKSYPFQVIEGSKGKNDDQLPKYH